MFLTSKLLKSAEFFTLEKAIQKLFEKASYYGVKFPVEAKGLLDKMDEIDWKGHRNEEANLKEVLRSISYKISYPDLLAMVLKHMQEVTNSDYVARDLPAQETLV